MVGNKMCRSKSANAEKGKQMNIRQKVGLGIMAPLFALAAGTTICQNTNKNNVQQNIEVVDNTQLEVLKNNDAYDTYAKQQAILNEFKIGSKKPEQVRKHWLTGEVIR